MRKKRILFVAIVAFCSLGCAENKPKEENRKVENEIETEKEEIQETEIAQAKDNEGIKEDVVFVPATCLSKSKYQDDKINSIEGVSLTVKEENYDVDLKDVIVTFSNMSEMEYDFGQFYEIEKQEEDGWYTLAYVPTEYELAWQDICYILEPESELEILIQTNLYGTYFEPGTYRIIKEIFPEGEPENLYPISGQFIVVKNL